MKVNYYSYNLETGYGTAALGYINIISKNNDVRLNHYVKTFADKKISQITKTFEDQEDINFFHMVPDDNDVSISPSAKNIISTVYEADKLTDFFVEGLKKYDEITVPCKWNLDTFKNYTNKKIHLLPYLSEYKGLNSTLTQKPSFLEGVADSTFVFLNVSDWVIRKNIENTILTFGKAFKPGDDVIFILKTSKRDISKRYYSNLFYDLNFFRKTKISFEHILKKHNIKVKILLIDNWLSTEEMKYLYNRANCYFTMTHAEGWGMGSYESAFYGKPVIATDFGGHLDFLKADNSYLIPSKIVPIKLSPWDNKEHHEGFTTADPDMDSAIELLRFVYANRELAEDKGKVLKNFVVNEFSEDKVGAVLREIISLN